MKELSPELLEYLRLSSQALSGEPDSFTLPEFDGSVREKIMRVELDLIDETDSPDDTASIT